mmetsp:Transcript_9223/g.27772  ORF Transcript_9223/g.27772 Transcript_9223/m.27772 type:complete len:909 (-) Transcript_9223:140-2866(-)
MSAPSRRPDIGQTKSPKVEIERDRLGERDANPRERGYGGPGRDGGPPRPPPSWGSSSFGFSGASSFQGQGGDRSKFFGRRPQVRRDWSRGWGTPRDSRDFGRLDPSALGRDLDHSRGMVRRPRSPRNGAGSRSPSSSPDGRFHNTSGERNWQLAGRKGSHRWGGDADEDGGSGDRSTKRDVGKKAYENGSDDGDDLDRGDHSKGDGKSKGDSNAFSSKKLLTAASTRSSSLQSPSVVSLQPDYVFSGLQTPTPAKEMGAEAVDEGPTEKLQASADPDRRSSAEVLDSSNCDEKNASATEYVEQKVPSSEQGARVSAAVQEECNDSAAADQVAGVDSKAATSKATPAITFSRDDTASADAEESRSGAAKPSHDTRKTELLSGIDNVDTDISAIKRKIAELKAACGSYLVEEAKKKDEQSLEGAPPSTSEPSERTTTEKAADMDTTTDKPSKTTEDTSTAVKEVPKIKEKKAAAEEEPTKVTDSSEVKPKDEPALERKSISEAEDVEEKADISSPIFGDEINVHSEFLQNLIIDVVRINRMQAYEAEKALLHLCHEKPAKLMSEYFYQKSEDSPAVLNAKEGFEGLKSKLVQHIAKKLRDEHIRKKTLSINYRQKRREWLGRLKLRDTLMSADDKQRRKDNDQYILMATRGTNIVTTIKEGGGVSYKPAQSGGSFGAPTTLREVEIMMDEIEQSNGTAGGIERWARTLTAIPDQQPNLPPFDVGPILVENPLAEHLAARSINPWTRGERILFLEKYVSHPKNFRKIASFFENKGVEDVVRFYFQNKMRLNLKQAVKETVVRRRGNATSKRPAAMLSGFPTDAASRKSINDNFLPDDSPKKVTKRQRVDDDMEDAWSAVEKSTFFDTLRLKGLDFEAIAHAISSKSPGDCEQFYRRSRCRVGPDAYVPAHR